MKEAFTPVALLIDLVLLKAKKVTYIKLPLTFLRFDIEHLELLSNVITIKSKIVLSASSLAEIQHEYSFRGRNWKENSFNQMTLNTLSIYLGYNNWDNFKKKIKQPKYLNIELEIPDHYTEEQIDELVGKTVTHLDDQYRYYGGNGLKVKDIEFTTSEVNTKATS